MLSRVATFAKDSRRAEDGMPCAANTRSAKDRHGLAWGGGEEEAGVNAIYTMTTIASLLAQSAYVQPRKGVRWREKGERKSERGREGERKGGREKRGRELLRHTGG